ncbi:unnamed protein product, partial [Tetraodon nigroviridis]
LMYQRMLAAEQSLKNEYYPFQERVFVLADPDVFSGPVGQVLSEDIETPSSGELLQALDHMRRAVQHGLQAVLGAEQCHGEKLAKALGVSEALPSFIPPPGGVSGPPAHAEIPECRACSSTP